MVPIGDQEPAAVGLNRVLEAGWDEEVCCRRMGYGPRTDVGHDCETVRAIHPIDADDIMAAEIRGDAGDQRVRGLVDKSDINHTTADEIQAREACWQPAGKKRDGSSLRVDAPDAACERRGDEQRPAGTDGTPLQLLQTR